MTKYENHRCNRYMEHQLIRMRKANAILYWTIAMNLIKRSNVFFIICLNKIFPKWHRELKLNFVIAIAVATRKIFANVNSKLDINRVYIKKANGSLRPLGVPSPAWRIYLHMWNQLIVYWLESRNLFHPSQHGYRPRRGTVTAWKEILTNVIHQPDIFEFDLKGFFDSVNLHYSREKLIEKGIPGFIANYLFYLNTCPINIRKSHLTEDYENTIKRTLHRGASFWDILKTPVSIGNYGAPKGVPQGAPTSPVLAALCLEGSILDRWPSNIKTLMYADDGLYSGNIGSTPLITPNTGMVKANISFNLNKSHWIKKEGKWLKELKFLGLVYNPWTGKLRASTRNGATLEFDKELMFDELHQRSLSEIAFENSDQYMEYRDRESWERWIGEKMWGWAQNRLYNDSWSLGDYFQDFQITGVKDSWYKKQTHTKVTVFNSSSFAAKDLLEIMKKVKKLKWRAKKA